MSKLGPADLEQIEKAPLNVMVVVANLNNEIVVELVENLKRHVDVQVLTLSKYMEMGRDYPLMEHEAIAIPFRNITHWTDFLSNQCRLTGKHFKYVK